MPLIIHKNINSHISIGIWEITESFDQLIELVDLEKDSTQFYLTNHTKQLQRLSIRCLLTNMFNNSVLLEYDEYGKPFIKNSNQQISISHTTKFAALIGNEKYPVGIDIELIHPRVEKIISKFMSLDEINSVVELNRLEQLYVYWCAKEALYKYYGKKELIFKENLFVDPFTYELIGGAITGHIRTNSFVKTLLLHYEKISDHILVYVAE